MCLSYNTYTSSICKNTEKCNCLGAVHNRLSSVFLRNVKSDFKRAMTRARYCRVFRGNLYQRLISAVPKILKGLNCCCFKNYRYIAMKMIPFQSCPFVSIHASLSFCCISFNMFFRAYCTFAFFSGYCNVSFYFTGSFDCHEITSFCVTQSL